MIASSKDVGSCPQCPFCDKVVSSKCGAYTGYIDFGSRLHMSRWQCEKGHRFRMILPLGFWDKMARTGIIPEEAKCDQLVTIEGCKPTL